jgi:hypothetical protein
MNIIPIASDMHDDELASALNNEVNAIDFEDARIHVLFGHHHSDIGKANLIARLGVLLEADFSILKFDGFLNTNGDGRYPSRTHHDFVIYRKFHSHIEFGGAHLLLGGPFLLDFLNRYGESREHLSFRPHVAKYFAIRMFTNWLELGRPKDLLVEVGGTFADLEVEAYVNPAIRLLQARHAATRLFLLAEAGFNREYIKTRGIVSGLSAGLAAGLNFDLLFVRLPMDLPATQDCEAVARYIERKIERSLVYGGASPSVLCIPFYRDEDLTGYTEYLLARRAQVFDR